MRSGSNLSCVPREPSPRAASRARSSRSRRRSWTPKAIAAKRRWCSPGDEVPRDTSLAKLAALAPVAREDGVHTAGTSSQIADGAAAVLMMSADRARSLGLEPLARVKASALVGCDPVMMLEGPIPATRRLLEKTGLAIEDIDVFEVNEAFASVVLAWSRTVGADLGRVNPNGGAIALGHPLGATGCLLTVKAVHELRRSGGRYGLISMCCGGGLGTGTLVERV